MIAFTELWDEICKKRFKVRSEKYRRFRYGMQVNSLGLTELQPENNVYRILIQMLPVVIAKNSRARAVQLPAWNEALGLPRPWDQQWSLRLQQIMAYETDLLEFDDVFEGSKVLKNKVNKSGFDNLFNFNSVPKDIRKIVDDETLGISRSERTGLDILLGNEPEVGVYLDSEKETLRIKKSKEKSLLSNPSPSINITDDKKLLIK